MTKEVDYVFCLSGLNFSDRYLDSWSKSLVMLTEDLKCSFAWEIFYCAVVSETRNVLIQRALKHKPKKIIFIDDDMVWEPEDLKQLITSSNDINTGFYLNRHNLAVAISHHNFLTQEDVSGTKPIELESVGLGFIAIKSKVFELTPYPWFESGHYENGTAYGEDYYFCRKVINFGFKVLGNPAIKVGHEKKIVYKWESNEAK